ncbi:hypothetical protein BJ508DRAFT_334957 [Ascobolus immersus RN42]|uniref:Uncharacterized protein n=1 Tax=Ascobolus immersus RN42 TaxID=1160509 RepID=A0A3N4HIM4_ASCIM|nr:hypothetical protein BJ508DRAFT_334957 [Ascobolus immersus RN42]
MTANLTTSTLKEELRQLTEKLLHLEQQEARKSAEASLSAKYAALHAALAKALSIEDLDHRRELEGFIEASVDNLLVLITASESKNKKDEDQVQARQIRRSINAVDHARKRVKLDSTSSEVSATTITASISVKRKRDEAQNTENINKGLCNEICVVCRTTKAKGISLLHKLAPRGLSARDIEAEGIRIQNGTLFQQNMLWKEQHWEAYRIAGDGSSYEGHFPCDCCDDLGLKRKTLPFARCYRMSLDGACANCIWTSRECLSRYDVEGGEEPLRYYRRATKPKTWLLGRCHVNHCS